MDRTTLNRRGLDRTAIVSGDIMAFSTFLEIGTISSKFPRRLEASRDSRDYDSDNFAEMTRDSGNYKESPMITICESA